MKESVEKAQLANVKRNTTLFPNFAKPGYILGYWIHHQARYEGNHL